MGGAAPARAGVLPPRSRRLALLRDAALNTFVLASASPARLATLRSAGIEPVVVVSGVDESVLDGLPPRELALGLAELKRDAVLDRAEVPSGVLVVGCDSVLELDGEVWGKPGTPELARERWLRMRGRAGVLHTGHAVVDLASGRTAEATGSTTVHFADLSEAEIDAYVATGEPLHVAGSFTIDGRGGAFVSRIEGDVHNVVGVSLPLLRELLAGIGLSWTDYWSD